MYEEGMIGEIRLFAGNNAPRGWMFCDGQTLTIPQYPALFAVLGPQYGGNGVYQFQLPNLAPLAESDGGQTPIRYMICLNGLFPRHP